MFWEKKMGFHDVWGKTSTGLIVDGKGLTGSVWDQKAKKLLKTVRRLQKVEKTKGGIKG